MGDAVDEARARLHVEVRALLDSAPGDRKEKAQDEANA